MALWNLYQEFEINNIKAKQAGTEAAHQGRIEGAQDKIWRLEDRVEGLLLIVDALWELSSERLGLTEDDLAARVREIDGRGGDVDGRRARIPQRCTACDAAIEAGRATCAFCGTAAPTAASPLDRV